MAKRKGKVKKLLLSQTKEQNEKNSKKIKELMTNELRDVIEYNIMKFCKNFEDRLGMSKDDILGDIMFQVWKGLVTFNKNKKANLKTYVITLINNRIRLLARRSGSKKYCFLSYSDFAGEAMADSGESLIERREQLLESVPDLTTLEKQVLLNLLDGLSLDVMCKENNIPLPVLVSVIKKIGTVNREGHGQSGKASR